MNPSIWKIPRVLRSKPSLKSTPRGRTAQGRRETTKKDRQRPVSTYLRSAMIGPADIGLRVQVHNGHLFVPIQITENHVGFRFGEFALTKKRVFHKRKKNK